MVEGRFERFQSVHGVIQGVSFYFDLDSSFLKEFSLTPGDCGFRVENFPRNGTLVRFDDRFPI